MGAKVRVVVGAVIGAIAFTSAAYFGAPARTPLVFGIAATIGLALGAFTGVMNDSWK